ncbi:MAG: hypothetical protein CBC12_07120 [Candidatus Puniceispirillum sp. TMED52]|nr:MAG: hypothetical protein CBC12_07120 [Candidatus Puniceispirillum sp. TMED52]
MKAQGGWGRNWDELLRNYSSGEDSDEHDTPNIVSFQKNCRRNAELIQSFIPHMTPEGANIIPPLLMQDPYVMHGDLLKSGFFGSDRSNASREGPGAEPSAQGSEHSHSNVESQQSEVSAPEKFDSVKARTTDEVASQDEKLLEKRKQVPPAPPASPLEEEQPERILESLKIECHAEECPAPSGSPVEAKMDVSQNSDGVLV